MSVLRRSIALVGCVALAAAAACGSTAHTSSGPTATSTTTTTIPAPTSTSPVPSTSTTIPATTVPTTTTVTTTPPQSLAEGAEGLEVVMLQQRLAELRYWMADDEGFYGNTTAHAVRAFQKRAGLAVDGVAGPLTADALGYAEVPVAQTAEGHVLEVDLNTQTLLLVDDGHVQWVFDTSTGARTGTTPRGRFTIFRQVDGYDHSPLGVLYRPKYFSGGVAVHGYPSVPSYPASHGCVRVVNDAMDWFWDTDQLPIGTAVLVY